MCHARKTGTNINWSEWKMKKKTNKNKKTTMKSVLRCWDMYTETNVNKLECSFFEK